MLEERLSMAAQTLVKCLLALFFLHGFPATASNPVQLPQDLTQAIQENAFAINPCRAVWKVHRVQRIPLDKLAGLLGFPEKTIEDYINLREEAHCAIDGEKIKVQFLYRRGGGDGFFEGKDISFNGSHVFYQDSYGEGRGIVDTMIVYGLEHAIKRLKEIGNSPEGMGIRSWQTNYWLMAGFVVPTTAFDFARQSNRSLVAYFSDENAQVVYDGSKEIDGRSCHAVAISTKGKRFVLYYDESLHYALRRQEEYDQENRLVRVVIANRFRKIPKTQSLYLPYEIKLEYYQQFGKPAAPYPEVLFDEYYVLESFDKASTPASDFELIPKVGTLVGDDRLPTAGERETGLVHFTMPASIDDLDAAIQHAIDGTPFVPSDLGGSNRSRLLLIAVNILAILFISVAVWRRRKFKS